jgi:hypothetical protein
MAFAHAKQLTNNARLYNVSKQHKIVYNLVQNCLAGNLRGSLVIQRRKRVAGGNLGVIFVILET